MVWPEGFRNTSNLFEPVELIPPYPDANLGYFTNLVRERRVDLPQHGAFALAGVYWRHIPRYGEFRQDKLLEEQELQFREAGLTDDDLSDD